MMRQLNVFPVAVVWNEEKGKNEKRPLTHGGSWKTYKASEDELSKAANFGVVVPEGMVFLDLDTYKGVTTDDVDALLGCKLPWDYALLQKTVSHGLHYCFDISSYGDVPLRQGSDLMGLVGFDVRCAGKGWIASGAGYVDCTEHGVLDELASEEWPTLPAAAFEALSRPKSHASNVIPHPASEGLAGELIAAAAADAARPLSGIDMDTAKAYLSRLPADWWAPQDNWLRAGMAMFHQFGGSSEAMQVWMDFAATAPGYGDADRTAHAARWASFGNRGGLLNPVTFASIISAGGGKLQGQDERTAADLVSRIAGMQAPITSAAIRELCAEAARMSDLECEEALTAIKGVSGRTLAVLRKEVAKTRQSWARTRAAGAAGKVQQYAPLDIDDLPDVYESDGKLRPRTTAANLEAVLRGYGVTARYNVVKRKAEFLVPGLASVGDEADNEALSRVMDMCEVNGFAMTRAAECAMAVAGANPCDPILDWIDGGPEWDGVDRIGALCDTLEVSDGFDWHRNIVVRRWLISAIAALRHAGFRSRGVLTLQGEQNLGKTYWLKSLVTPPLLCDSVICEDHLLDPDSKDNVLTVVTHWLVELGELESTFRRDMGRIKGFLTSSCDVVRRPYARLESSFTRRTVFFASVNSDTFLTDPTGDSRFWTLPVTRVDYTHGIDMQQVWRQVSELYYAGEQWWLTPEESEGLKALNEQFLVPSTLEDTVRHRYEMGGEKSTWTEKTPFMALQELGFATPTDSQRMSIGRALTKVFGKPRFSNGKKLYLMPALKTFTLHD